MIFKLFRETYHDRVESQQELHDILENIFGDRTHLNFEQFLFTIENVNSDIFLFIIIYLYENKPFNKITLDNFERAKTSNESCCADATSIFKKMIVSPNLNSKFSPSIAISKSPIVYKKNLGKLKISNTYRDDNDSRDLLNKFAKMKTNSIAKSVLLKYAQSNLANTLKKNGLIIKEVSAENEDSNKPTVHKKNLQYSIFKKIEDFSDIKNFSGNGVNDEMQSYTESLKKTLTDLTIGYVVKYKVQNNITLQSKEISDLINQLKISEDQESNSEDAEVAEYEGYIYKITNSRNLKRLWFKLTHKDLYCKYINYSYI
jgi:hypothetical protein